MADPEAPHPGRVVPNRVLPNNFGPTVLIALGVLAAPVGVGVPLLLVGLARLKTAHGASAFPLLAALHHQWLGWWVR